jgi:6-phosphogluconolactonase
MSIPRGAEVLVAATFVLSGCGGGGCDNCSPVNQTLNIDANITGLVGSRLAMTNNGVAVTIAPGATGKVPAVFSGLENGASYAVTVTTQPTTPLQSCIVTNGTGAIAGANAEISVACTTTPARFLFVQNVQSSQPCITTATIDSDSGALTPIAPPPLCGLLAGSSMAVDLRGKFLYMTPPGGQIGTFEGFIIDQSTGAVSSNFEQEIEEPRTLATDPSGKFLIVAHDGPGGLDGGVEALTIDSATGAVTAASGSNSVNFNNFHPNFTAVVVDPLDRFVYVPLDFSSVIPLTFDSNTGALSNAATPAVLSENTAWLAADPSGRFLYVGSFPDSSDASTISAFNVDPSNGTLTPIPGSPPAITVGFAPTAAIDPSGQYLYLANGDTAGQISAYAIDHNSGQLTPINGSPFSTGASPSSIVIEPLGRFVYVSDASGVSAFSIDSANGSLTPINGSPFPIASPGALTVSY